jgi:TonB-dependent SusC/RagA subfamily outer membrane receptor
MSSFQTPAFVPALIVGFVTGCASPNDRVAPRPEPQAVPGKTIIAADIERIPVGEPVMQALMDRFPGIDAQQLPGGRVSIRIRGPASFYASGEPLYVIDGTPIEAGPPGGFVGINPYDIESITVLKNPAETAIYGIRGGNGVIVITTKRPGG